MAPFTTININNDVILTHNSIVALSNNTFNIAAGKSLTLSGSDMNLTSSFDFSDSGTLILSGDNTTYNPSSVSNAVNAVLNINNNVTTNMPSVLTINTINIADGKSFTIDAVNSDIDLLDNNASINFGGSGAVLVLTNSGDTDHQFTLFTNLNPSSTTDNYGIVRVGATTNGLTIANNAGPYTIGQDNTHRLQNFIVEGAGSIVIDNTVFTKLLSMNGTGQVTFNQALDLGAAGNIAFGAAGKLISDGGITGDIDFNNTAGILEINTNDDNFSSLNTVITNADNATLNIKSSVITSSDSIGNVNEINIDNTKFLVISADNKNINLLENGHVIKFGGISAVLALINSDSNTLGTITLNDNLPGLTDGGGVLELSGTKLLTLQGADEIRSLGTANNKLKSLYILSNVTIEDSIDASNAGKLFIVNGAMFVDNSTTTVSIPTINIGSGVSFPNTDILSGPATYILEVQNKDINPKLASQRLLTA